MHFKSLKSEKLSEKVIKEFEEMIEKGALKPGDKLPSERDLSQQMGISRGILREALRTLESKGYINRKPGGGTYIRELTYSQNTGQKLINALKHATYLDLLEIREILEQKIVELAVERATDEDILEMEKILEHCQNANEYDPKMDHAFHLSIASATKNALMANFMAANLELIKDITTRTHNNPNRLKEMINEHKKIMDAIKARNAEKAQKALLEHLHNVRKAIEKSFEETEEKEDAKN
ncbi:MAG TPA: FadR family transcriptional regulator [Thermoanaerobacterales bacterium]|nr:FadR family transcriptional regulator [Thermoanaerobacterales bacterium]